MIRIPILRKVQFDFAFVTTGRHFTFFSVIFQSLFEVDLLEQIKSDFGLISFFKLLESDAVREIVISVGRFISCFPSSIIRYLKQICLVEVHFLVAFFASRWRLSSFVGVRFTERITFHHLENKAGYNVIS